jgi:hypothetical protein
MFIPDPGYGSFPSRNLDSDLDYWYKGKKKRGSWIHIRNTISNSTKLCRGSVSGSSQIRITDRDDIHGMQIQIQPIGNCFQFHENEDVDKLEFQLKFQYAVQTIEIYDNFETSEKEKVM